MKIEEFYREYANTPFNKRFGIINVNKGCLRNLSSIKEELDILEDIMRPARIKEEELLELASEGFKDLVKQEAQGKGRMDKHKVKTKLARKMRTRQELKEKVSIWLTKAWEIKKEAKLNKKIRQEANRKDK